MGVYCINAARYLFGAEPTKVLALNASNPEPRFKKVDEMMSAILHFPDERLGSFTCSFGAADISRYTVVGTKGVMISDPAYEYAMDIEQEIVARGKEIQKKVCQAGPVCRANRVFLRLHSGKQDTGTLWA